MAQNVAARTFVQELHAPTVSVSWVWGTQDVPHTFFYTVRVHASALPHALPHVLISLEDPWDMVMSRVSMTLLGQEQVCWLTGYSDLSAALRKRYDAFLRSYTGPHRLIVWTGDQVPAIPDTQRGYDYTSYSVTTVDDLEALVRMWHDSPVRRDVYTGLLSHVKRLNLDECARLLPYLALVGRNSASFLQELLPHIIAPEHSLYKCAGAFFSRDRREFTTQWHALEPLYGIEFWTVFWSEQLAQAHRFCQAREVEGLSGAKKQHQRLPFSFLQKDHARWSAQECAEALAQLYAVEHRVKEGGHHGVLTYTLHRLLFSGH